VKRHAELGADFIGTFKSLTQLVPAIRHHHERWDGLGYPDGLQGEDIPLAARIIAAADAFVAMTEPRTYRMQLDGAGAMAELLDASGTQFDPTIIRVMHGIWGQVSRGEPNDVGTVRAQMRDPNGSWALETQAPRLLGLLQASLAASDERDFYDMVWQVLSSHCELAGGALWCVRDVADLVCVDVYGFLLQGVDIGECGRGLEQLALRERVAVGSTDLMNDSRFRPGHWVSEAGFGVAIALPLIASERVLGVLTVYRGAGGRFSAGDQAVLELGAAMVARGLDGLQRASYGDSDTQKDALTGLNSERAFAKALHTAVEQASMHGHSCGMILVDINGFDELNARYGFDWGDAVLRRIAHMIGDWLPADAIAARSGADDFVILLPLVSAGDVMVHAENLRRVLATLSDGVEQGESTGLRLCIGVTSQVGTACVSRVLWQDVRQALQRAKDEVNQHPVYLARTHP
jgi:diguanylate cyclase (GGDEF)-like protein